MDARYSYSGIIGSSTLILLDEMELATYRASGRDYLSDLALRIHNGPDRKESPCFARGLYRGPDCEPYRREVSAAVADHTWMPAQRRAADWGEPSAST